MAPCMPSKKQHTEIVQLLQMYRWGCLGASMHMMEILPLLGLQTGLTSLPFIMSSFVIALFQSAT